MSVDKLQQRIEATVHVRGRDIFCESTDADLYAAIDGLVDKLDRQIIKHKEKTVEQRHNGAARPRLAE
jgi:putative sigma-54 modulation protein